MPAKIERPKLSIDPLNHPRQITQGLFGDYYRDFKSVEISSASYGCRITFYYDGTFYDLTVDLKQEGQENPTL